LNQQSRKSDISKLQQHISNLSLTGTTGQLQRSLTDANSHPPKIETITQTPKKEPVAEVISEETSEKPAIDPEDAPFV